MNNPPQPGHNDMTRAIAAALLNVPATEITLNWAPTGKAESLWQISGRDRHDNQFIAHGTTQLEALYEWSRVVPRRKTRE